MNEEVITLDSSDDETETVVLKPVPAPPYPPPNDRKRKVELVRLGSASKVNLSSTVLNGNTAENAKSEEDVVVVLSSDDEETIVSEARTPLLKKRRGQLNSLATHASKGEEPSSSTTTTTTAMCSTIDNSDKPTNGLNGAAMAKETGEGVPRDNGGNENDVEVVESDGASDVLHTDCQKEIDKLLAVLARKISCQDKKKLRKKLERKLEKLRGEEGVSENHHATLCRRIILTRQEIARNPHTGVWSTIKILMNQFDSKNLCEDSEFKFESETPEEKKARIEATKDKRIQTLEKTMKKYEAMIAKYDFADVDWDKEHNSKHLQKERVMEKLSKAWETLCELTNSTKQTGRPVQKAIRLENITKYPEIEERVQNFVNRMGYMKAPAYYEVLDVVQSASTDHSLHLSQDDCSEIAKQLHRNFVEKRQRLREIDSCYALPSSLDEMLKTTRDPAEDDKQLEALLRENARKARTVQSVLDDFAQKQASSSRKRPLLDLDTDPASFGEEVPVDLGDRDDDDDASDTSSRNGVDEDDEDDDDETVVESEAGTDDVADIDTIREDVEVTCGAGLERLFEFEDEDDAVSQDSGFQTPQSKPNVESSTTEAEELELLALQSGTIVAVYVGDEDEGDHNGPIPTKKAGFAEPESTEAISTTTLIPENNNSIVVVASEECPEISSSSGDQEG